MPPKQFTIATMNLRNLQIPGGLTYGGKKTGKKEFEGKVYWTANMLQKLDADVIGFQELWHPTALEKAFSKAGLLPDYELISTIDSKGVTVALAVRKPLNVVHSKWEREVPKELILKKSEKSFQFEPDYEIDINIENFSRAVLRTNVEIEEGLNVIFYVAHLKSKLPMDISREDYMEDDIKPHRTALGSALSTIRRTAEAAGLRVILNKTLRDTDTPVVLMGDLNDSHNSVTHSIITEDPSYRLYSKSRRGNRSDRGMYSVATMQKLRSLRDVYYTYIHDGFRESLDHILVSEQFYDYSKNRIWSFEETRVINDHIDNKKGKGYASDHGVVVSKFLFDPQKK